MNSHNVGSVHWLVGLMTLCLFTGAVSAEQISFAALPVDTPIADQFSQHLTFTPYNGNITGVVVPSPSGNAASFTGCTGGVVCEFFTPGARVLFKNKHTHVTARVVPLPAQISFTIDLRLTAYAADGSVVGFTDSTLSSNDSLRGILVGSTVQNIASVVLESKQTQVQGNFGLVTLHFEDLPPNGTVPPNSPDFILYGPEYLTLIAGGPPVNVGALNLHRMGGSTGAVTFSSTGQPGGLNVSASPSPSVGDASALSVTADAGLAPGIYAVTITATPAASSVGPAPRSIKLFVTVRPGLEILAPASVDLASCQNAGAASGTIQIPVTVLRAGSVAPPADVSLADLPAEVSAALAPTHLDFPGNVVGQTSTLTLTVASGVSIASTPIKISASTGLFFARRTVELFGTCPRVSNNFVVRGWYACINKGTATPIEGAVVHIMRDDYLAFDPTVAETVTRADGTFEAQVSAGDVDTFYAKLFLNDRQGVYLRNWWSQDVHEINSFRRGRNESSIVDLGGSVSSRDGGAGTPRCAIWQGGRAAWQDVVAMTGTRPVIGDWGDYQIVMESTASGIVWTSRDTTHWEDNSGTTRFSGAAPAAPANYRDLLEFYGTNFHEFGHALRHTADANTEGFWIDAGRFTYGRPHDICEGSPDGYIETDGYAFNEGWAEYWEDFPPWYLHGHCAGQLDLTDLSVEGAVANDLHKLAATLGACAGIDPAVTGDALLRKRRALMFDTLKSLGREKIHAETEFRAAFAQKWPSCALPAIGFAAPPAKAIQPGGWLISSAYAAEPEKKARSSARPTLSSMSEFVRKADAELKLLRAELAQADSGAQSGRGGSEGEQKAIALTRAPFIQAQIAYIELLKQRFVAADAARAQKIDRFTALAEGQSEFDAAAFDSSARAIASTALAAARNILMDKDEQGFAKEIATLARQERELQRSTVSGKFADRSVAAMLEVKPLWAPDATSADEKSLGRTATQSVRGMWWLLLAGAAIVAIALVVLQRRRATT